MLAPTSTTQTTEDKHIFYAWNDTTRTKTIPSLHYTRDEEHTNVIIQKYFILSGQVGFDLEWKPNVVGGAREHPVALVQIASKKAILLAQVSAMKTFPTRLRRLLKNPNIMKIGIGIHEDCKKLFADFGVQVRTCVELSYLAKSVHPDRWPSTTNSDFKPMIGLSRMSLAYTGLELDKAEDVTRSDWEMKLTKKMRNYAANDCHCALAIYNILAPESLAVSKAHFTFDVVFGQQQTPSGEPWMPVRPSRMVFPVKALNAANSTNLFKSRGTSSQLQPQFRQSEPKVNHPDIIQKQISTARAEPKADPTFGEFVVSSLFLILLIWAAMRYFDISLPSIPEPIVHPET